jgi:multidrug efflux system membrane fusion protein
LELPKLQTTVLAASPPLRPCLLRLLWRRGFDADFQFERKEQLQFLMRWKLVTIVGLIIVGAGGGWSYLKGGAVKTPPPAPPPPVPVVAQQVKSSDVPIYLKGIGTVYAFNTVIVRSQITGQLIQIAFREGQKVKKGDLLAEIDPRPYQALIDQYTANKKRDQAQLTNAKANLGRYTPLEQKGFATQQLVETQQAQVNELEAAMQSDDAAIRAAEVQLSYTRLTSPIDGVTGIRQIDIGNIIYPTDVNGLVTVTQVEPISVIFTLPEGDLPQIQQQLAKGPLTVFAYSQDNKIKLGEGRFVLVNNQINQTTGTLQIKANFPNEDHKLWPGQLINAWLLLDTRHNALTVAASAVQQGPDGSYAYVIKPGGIAERQPLKVAQISSGQALIDSGLAANEDVVVDGQYRLRPGDHVTILHGRAAAEAAAQSEQQMEIP